MAALASAPRMVGRQAELARLLEAVDEGRDSRPRIAIVRGEAGIGKTRLVSALVDALASRPAEAMPLLLAHGQCVDLGPIGTPFGPVRRVLRDLEDAVGGETLRAAAGSAPAAALISGLLPTLGEPGADAHSGELAEAIAVLLETLSERHRLVIVLEDLQWADAATLALLRNLAGGVRSETLTIVATYRSDDVDRFHPLRAVIAELERRRSVVRVDLVPLGAEEVAEQAAMLSDRLLSPDDLRVLVERSGGVPFLVEELVDLDGADLPDTLRDLVLARYGRLSEGTRGVLRTMAAGGVRIGHDDLRAVVGIDDDALDVALREAIDARVILADGEGYAFRHALTQEAVHAEMLPSERVRVHRRFAEHLSEREGVSPDAVSAVAEHWLVAREIPSAFDATVRALAASQAAFAPAISATLVERLTELWPQVPDAAQRAGTSLAGLHLEAALAWYRLGEPERGLRAAEEGLAVVADDDRLTRVALLRHRFVHLANSGQEPGTTDLDEAFALLADATEPSARLLLSRILTNFAQADPQAQEARDRLGRAIAIAREVGDAEALAVALTTLSDFTAEAEQDEPAALEPLDEALTLDLDPAMRLFVARAQVEILSRLGRFAEAAERGARHHADAVAAGIERGNATYLAVTVAHAYFAAGEPDPALRFVRRARRLLDRGGRRPAVRTLATYFAWNDQPEEREALFEADRAAFEVVRAGRVPRRGWWTPDVVDSVVGAAAGRRPPSTSAVEEALRGILDELSRDQSGPARRYAVVAVALLLRALPPGANDDARSLVATEVATWPARGTAPTVAAFIAAVLLDADAAAAELRVDAWRSVADALQDGVMPIRFRSLARLSLGAALLSAGDRDDAERTLTELAGQARAGGVAAVARHAEALIERGGLRPGAADDVRATLTPRELQVLALVAEGLTNPQIGERLFISPKTASVHVSAILAKIGAANRAEAAAWFTATDAATGATAG